MFITSKRIPANLMAKLEGKVRIPDGNFVYTIERKSRQIEITRWNPTFQPNVLAGESDINVTPKYILKPCTWFKGSFKVSDATEEVKSASMLSPSVGRTVTRKINKRKAAETLRLTFERLA